MYFGSWDEFGLHQIEGSGRECDPKLRWVFDENWLDLFPYGKKVNWMVTFVWNERCSTCSFKTKRPNTSPLVQCTHSNPFPNGFLSISILFCAPSYFRVFCCCCFCCCCSSCCFVVMNGPEDPSDVRFNHFATIQLSFLFLS